MPRAILWCMVALAGCTRERTGRLPNIILITLDTTRADGLGCYGNPRNVTPTLDALAREASVYTRAHATSSWTLPSHASLSTGKFLSSHGAGYAADGNLRLSDALGESDYYDKHQVAALADSEVTPARCCAMRVIERQAWWPAHG
ncbi:MAG: sulfatase-like hydrolase/transferase [Planctomycetota bacterium]